MAGNMPKEEAMLNYVEELQKVHLLCVYVHVRWKGRDGCVVMVDCRDNATVQGGRRFLTQHRTIL